MAEEEVSVGSAALSSPSDPVGDDAAHAAAYRWVEAAVKRGRAVGRGAAAGAELVVRLAVATAHRLG